MHLPEDAKGDHLFGGMLDPYRSCGQEIGRDNELSWMLCLILFANLSDQDFLTFVPQSE